jgi:hypothetical protein
MDNQQAKFILQAYRPNGKDAQDPFFKEALEQAQRDPGLGEWFAAERTCDGAICAKLEEVPIPADLKTTILMSHSMSGKRFPSLSTILEWLSPKPAMAFAFAACVAIGLLALGLFNLKGPSTSGSFQDSVAHFAATQDLTPKHMTADMKEIRTWLAEKDGPSQFNLPKSIEELASIGCQVADLDGQKVSIVCFWVNQENKEAVHLFVADRFKIKNPPPYNAPPVYAKNGKIVTASWSDSKYAYTLTGEGDENYLKTFL